MAERSAAAILDWNAASSACLVGPAHPPGETWLDRSQAIAAERCSEVDSARIRSLRSALLPLSVVVAVVRVGTLGYFWLWLEQGGTWMDALFMTVTTITRGYGEVRRSTRSAVSSHGLAIAGIGSLSTRSAWSWSTGSGTAGRPGRERRMERSHRSSRQHIIVAGLGRVGGQALTSCSRPRRIRVVDPVRRRATRRGGGLSPAEATRPRTPCSSAPDSSRERTGVTTGNDATTCNHPLRARLNPDLYIVSERRTTRA